MLVLRKTMDAAVAAERAHSQTLATRFGSALERVTALQQQLSAWLMNKGGDITPQQAAQMFYAQNDIWQADFFNTMQQQVLAHHASLPPVRPGEYNPGPGVPAGEGQWWHMAGNLTDEGFETLKAMYEHAEYQRQSEAA